MRKALSFFASMALFVLAVTCLCAVATFAQSPDTLPTLPPLDVFQGTKDEVASKLLSWYNFLYFAATWVVVRFSYTIPFFNKITSLTLRGGLLAVVTLVSFLVLKGEAWQVLIGFFGIVNWPGLFEKVVGKTPKTEAEETLV